VLCRAGWGPGISGAVDSARRAAGGGSRVKIYRKLIYLVNINSTPSNLFHPHSLSPATPSKSPSPDTPPPRLHPPPCRSPPPSTSRNDPNAHPGHTSPLPKHHVIAPLTTTTARPPIEPNETRARLARDSPEPLRKRRSHSTRLKKLANQQLPPAAPETKILRQWEGSGHHDIRKPVHTDCPAGV
jgi:hypothetical protein